MNWGCVDKRTGVHLGVREDEGGSQMCVSMTHSTIDHGRVRVYSFFRVYSLSMNKTLNLGHLYAYPPLEIDFKHGR